MSAKGIVKRIDDLGRVVIPKEIRKSLKLPEGTPMEIYVEDDMICLKKYQPVKDADFKKAKNILAPLLPQFAILDGYGEFRGAHNLPTPISLAQADADKPLYVKHITECGDRLAYIVVTTDCDIERLEIAQKVLENFLSED